MTKLQYYCVHCNNVVVVKRKHLCFLLQFMRDSTDITKNYRVTRKFLFALSNDVVVKLLCISVGFLHVTLTIA